MHRILPPRIDKGWDQNKEMEIHMFRMNFTNAVGISVLAAGLAASAFGQAGPYKFTAEYLGLNKGDLLAGLQYDLDFTKTSVNPALNYPTFTNPRDARFTVKFHPHFFSTQVGPGSCYEIQSSGPAGSDLLLSVQNAAGAFVWLADDNNGGGQFRARLYVRPGAQTITRISEFTSPNNLNQNGIIVRKFNLDPGIAITPTSCRAAGVPFWQIDVNGGNPLNPS